MISGAVWASDGLARRDLVPTLGLGLPSLFGLLAEGAAWHSTACASPTALRCSWSWEARADFDVCEADGVGLEGRELAGRRRRGLRWGAPDALGARWRELGHRSHGDALWKGECRPGVPAIAALNRSGARLARVAPASQPCEL